MSALALWVKCETFSIWVLGLQLVALVGLVLHDH